MKLKLKPIPEIGNGMKVWGDMVGARSYVVTYDPSHPGLGYHISTKTIGDHAATIDPRRFKSFDEAVAACERMQQ